MTLFRIDCFLIVGFAREYVKLVKNCQPIIIIKLICSMTNQNRYGTNTKIDLESSEDWERNVAQVPHTHH